MANHIVSMYREDYTKALQNATFAMKIYRKQLRRDALLAFAFLVSIATPTLAQQPPGPPVERTNPDRERQQDMNRREMTLRNYGMVAARPSNRDKVKALADQVGQDFGRILILHNEIAHAISGANRLDYGFVSDAASEIRKRASRLQTNLVLKPDEAGQTPERKIGANELQVKDALVTLCKKIRSFVTNPLIENPGTVNVDQLNKARQDLQIVVDLSSDIQKTADKLAKSHK